MLSAENLAEIRAGGERILELARRDRERAVPQYPGWVVFDLAAHLGSIHARTTLICRELPADRPSAPRPPEDTDVLDWYEGNLEEMLSVLGAADPDTRVWGFWPESTLGLWERRMVIETGLHRWDADQAFGDPGALTDRVALSGLDEFETMWLPRLGELPVLEVKAADLGRTWMFASGSPLRTVIGTTSDLYLRLMSRPSTVELPPQWAAAVDALEPPP
ncbi:MAG TPA: maleylpyruvate isomerase family mycothiol-dependent enzyme, partial [Acidimicrobiia bacterium]|nr:maleylpyruvate isomerase family mycothiol-dependent enzyme [Acidimicrobiia bacterium]